jgi:hypothetical protein
VVVLPAASRARAIWFRPQSLQDASVFLFIMRLLFLVLVLLVVVVAVFLLLSS